MSNFKFQDHSDAAMFAIEEGLINFTEASSKTKEEIEEICEAHIVDRDQVRKDRRRKKGRIRDHRRSRAMKKAWSKNRRRFTAGIKKFNRSMKGKKLRKEVARMKKQGRYSSIAEAMTVFSSTITHLSIQSQYLSSINEELDSEELLSEGCRILTPILEALSGCPEAEDFELSEIVGKDLADEAEQFLSDLILGDDLPSDCCEETEILEANKAYSQKSLFGGDVTGDFDDDPDTRDEIRDKAKILGEKLLGNNDNQITGVEVKKAEDSNEEVVKTAEETAEQTADPERVEEDLTPVEVHDLHDISESLEEVGFILSDQYEIINEASGDPDVDGVHVIAKVRGPAFFPGRVSENKVEYTNELWEKALNRPEFQVELKARRIYGTIGHDQEINDKAIREGKIGHIVSDMWIDKKTNTGMAEYLLLNSEPGRMTLTLLGAKSKFRVSTRCKGKFLNRCNVKGNKEPNPDLFFIKGVDFVHDPGFKDTEATLV